MDEPARQDAAPTPAVAAVTAEPRSTTRRVLVTVLAVSVTALVVVYPLFFAALFAAIEWSGCFLECREPDPNRAVAVAAGLVAILLLALPVLAGVLAWRGPSRRLILVYVVGTVPAAYWLLRVAV